MTPAEVQAFLHRQIPISAAMGVRVRASDAGGVTLVAPLAPNINHRATLFGGSASAIAILAAWAWLHLKLRADGQAARLVIQSNQISYLSPIAGDFEARSVAPPDPTVEKFLRTLRRYGRARIVVGATLTCGGRKAVAFSGDYVALRC